MGALAYPDFVLGSGSPMGSAAMAPATVEKSAARGLMPVEAD
jgi:hypothetical protein